MVTAVERIQQEQISDAASLGNLRLDSKGLGEFDVAKVNPVNPEFNIAQINKEKEPIINDQNIKFYLPKDEELRQKILDAREDIRTIFNEMTKEDFSDADKSQYIDFYLQQNNLTRDQVAGKYPKP